MGLFSGFYVGWVKSALTHHPLALFWWVCADLTHPTLFPGELGTARFILGVWFVILGAAIGSFLNVVIYRIPAGLNIAWPGSHCPKCKHAIRWYDNLPVFGWLILHGKCRDCHATISIRYPIVEALTAGVFFLLAWCELVRYENAGLVLGLADLRGPYLTRFIVCLLHCGLMAALLAATGIALDGKKTSWKLAMPIVLLITLAGLIAWSMLATLPEQQ